MNKRFLVAIALASSLSFASYDVIARGAPPAAAPAAKPAPAKAAPAAPPAAKTAPASKPTLEAGPAAKGAPPPLLKPAAPDPSGKVVSPPSSGTPTAQGKPSFDNAAAQAQKTQDQQATMKKAEADRLAAAQAKRESDAAIARAQASSRGATAPAGQSVADADRMRRLEQSNRDLRDSNRYLRRDRADAREAALRAQYHYGSPYAFRSSYSDIFVGSMIWSMWSNWNARQQAEWMYHHQSQMDQMRYQELLNSNAQLRSEVQNLERQSIARNSAYVPPQLAGNEDLMYAQNATQIAQQQAAQVQAELAAAQRATANTPVAQTPVASPQAAASVGSNWLIWTILVLVLIGGGAFFWLRREAK